MLSVKNLHASVDGKEILRGIDLEVKAGEVHAVMGPNGSGKSTLAAVLAGNEKFTVTEGSATFLGRDLLEMPIEDRARLGLFLGFQYPVEIPGVTMANFMKLAVNEQRKFRGEEPLTAAEFLKLMREKSAVVELDSKLTSRAVNEGFSGGEKKKNEIFQMAMLDPKLAILPVGRGVFAARLHLLLDFVKDFDVFRVDEGARPLFQLADLLKTRVNDSVVDPDKRRHGLGALIGQIKFKGIHAPGLHHIRDLINLSLGENALVEGAVHIGVALKTLNADGELLMERQRLIQEVNHRGDAAHGSRSGGTDAVLLPIPARPADMDMGIDYAGQ